MDHNNLIHLVTVNGSRLEQGTLAAKTTGFRSEWPYQAQTQYISKKDNNDTR